MESSRSFRYLDWCGLGHLHELGRDVHEAEVRLEHLRHPRLLDLDHHVLPGLQGSRIHLLQVKPIQEGDVSGPDFILKRGHTLDVGRKNEVTFDAPDKLLTSFYRGYDDPLGTTLRKACGSKAHSRIHPTHHVRNLISGPP